MCALLALAILAPVLGRGFVLSYDMVFAPRHDLLPDALGLGSTPARSVPADAYMALATALLPGDVVQQLLLAAALFLGPYGAGRLVPTPALGPRIVAAVFYGWTPYIAERLLMGHWPYLLAYACLPWIVAAGLAVRGGDDRALGRLLLWCVPAAITPTGGLIAAGAALAATGRRRLAVVAAGAVVLNAPWWVPSVLRPAAVVSAPEAVDLFAARAENWGGPVMSVLGLGGFWNADAVPASRALPVVPVVTAVLTAVALVGCARLARRWGTRPVRALLLLAGLGVLISLSATVPGLAEVLRWAVAEVPGAGLLRDAQKWVAWWALPLALGVALAAERAVVALVPLALLPDLAWGGWGALAAVDYPPDWAHVRQIVADDPHPGDVLALPLGALRQYGWNGHRTQLDPAPRYLPRPVVIDDTVHVGGVPVPGEDPRLPAVREALAAQGNLADLGIGWVLVEHGTPGSIDPRTLAVLEEAHRGEWLSLYRVPGPVAPPPELGPPAAAVLAADGIYLLVIAGTLLWQVIPAGRFGRNRRGEEST
ncbi:hypothetical protein [Actinokineospora sp. NPDC004072]